MEALFADLLREMLGLPSKGDAKRVLSNPEFSLNDYLREA
jgi:hypothetical protein